MKNLFLIEHIPTQESNICYLSYHRANFEKWKSVYSSTVCTLCVGCNASPPDVESSTQRWINMTTKFVLRSDIEWKRWEIVRNQPYRRKCHNGLIWCSSESYELYPWYVKRPNNQVFAVHCAQVHDKQFNVLLRDLKNWNHTETGYDGHQCSRLCVWEFNLQILLNAWLRVQISLISG